MVHRSVLTCVAALATTLFFADIGEAQVSPCHVNGGFETGDFSGWTPFGRTGIVGPSFGVAPTEGSQQAFLATGYVGLGATGSAATQLQIEGFLGLAPGTLDTLVATTGGTTRFPYGSAMSTSIDVFADEVIEFDWNFLTDEAVPNPLNDYAFVTVTCDGVLLLADTFSNMVSGAAGFTWQTGYQTFSFSCPTDGTIEIGVGVIDAFDQITASGLLVDNLVCNGPPNTAPGCSLDLSLASSDFATDDFGGFIVTEGDMLEVPFTATDDDGDLLDVTLLGLPAGAVLETVDTADGLAGTISWSPTAADQAGAPYTATLVSTDPDGAESTCSFEVGAINLHPMCSVEGGTEGILQLEADESGVATVDLVATGSDPDGDALAYLWTLSDPAAVVADPTQSATSATLPLGETLATVTVDDGYGGVSSCELTVVVVEGDSGDTTPPGISVSLERMRGKGLRYRVVVTAEDDSGEVMDVSIMLHVDGHDPMPVEENDVIYFARSKKKVKVLHCEHGLLILAPEIRLVATAVDAAGNEGSAEAVEEGRRGKLKLKHKNHKHGKHKHGH